MYDSTIKISFFCSIRKVESNNHVIVIKFYLKCIGDMKMNGINDYM